MSIYVKCYVSEIKWIDVWIKGDELLRKYIIRGIESAIVLKRALMWTHIQKINLKTKIRSYSDEATDLCTKTKYLRQALIIFADQWF